MRVLRSLTLFLPTEASRLGPGGAAHFQNHSDYCFIPLHSLPSFLPSPSPTPPLPTPPPPPTPLRRWKELHQTSSCSRAKCPSTTLNSPGYLKPPASLIPLSINSVLFNIPGSYFFYSPSLSSFLSSSSSHMASLHQPASVSAVSHCRCFISERAFSLISLPPSCSSSLLTGFLKHMDSATELHNNKKGTPECYSCNTCIWYSAKKDIIPLQFGN